MGRIFSFPALILLLPSCKALAADAVFSGSLERVGRESISLRLADRREIEARLPNTRILAAGKIATQYHIGDQVEITCRSIKPVWEEDMSRYQFLELTKLRFLRLPSAEELSKMLEVRPWRGEGNLLTRTNATASAPDSELPEAPRPKAAVLNAAALDKLEHAREVNLEYASNMPNFLADETAKRYTSDGTSPQWRYLDTIQTEITFSGSRAVRQKIRRNGRPWGRPFQALPGFKWSGGFGSEIGPLFDAQCPTTIEYEGPAQLRGKPLLKYRFSSPADGCFVPFYVEYQRYNPARTGHVFLDDPAGNVIQLDEEASGFPAAFEIAQRTEEVTWDHVKIGGDPYLLPVGANFVISFSAGKRWRIEVQYTNHRHFESSSDITFH